LKTPTSPQTHTPLKPPKPHNLKPHCAADEGAKPSKTPKNWAGGGTENPKSKRLQRKPKAKAETNKQPNGTQPGKGKRHLLFPR
jgi:hypothetical protein